jgi:hypothetical protein
MKPQPSIEDLKAVWPVIAKDVLGSTLECLSAARSEGGGDVDLYLIMLAVALRTVEHQDFQSLSYEDLAAGLGAELPSLTTNVRSIADSLGMPRETARRKVATLIEMGWIDNVGHSLRVAQQHGPRATAMRELLLKAVLRQYLAVGSALEKQAHSSGER